MLAMAVIRKTMLAALAGSALLTAAPSFAEDAKQDISRFMLDNGLEVVVIPDHRAPVVTHMLWYKTGAADEAPGKSGIAHFFEHLMFKGTSNHPQGEFSRAVTEIGSTHRCSPAPHPHGRRRHQPVRNRPCASRGRSGQS